MQLRHFVPALAIAGLALALSACGAGKNQSPVASDEQLATTHPEDMLSDMASTYTTRLGDSLGSIAARPEVYSDPELWPLLADANGDRIKDPDASTVLPEDLLLDIPRGLEGTVLEVARERARSAQAMTKAADKPKRRRKTPQLIDLAASSSSTAAPAPTPEPVAAVEAAVEPTVEPTAVPTAVAAAAEKPKPKSQRSVLPLFLLLLLLLGALGGILAYFLKRDKQEGA